MASIETLFGMHGKVALVTGGGRGVGRAVCELFAQAGARIAVCDIDETTAREVAGALPDAAGYRVDISNEDEVERTFAQAAERFGRLDALVHVAAIFPKRDFLTMTAAQWDEIQAVNTRGTFLVMREAIKAMKAGGRGGAIVNISSTSGERASVTNNSGYGASKAATTNLTRSMAIETAEVGIRINAVLPGAVATEGAKAATERMKDDGLQIGGPMTGAGRMPLGRVGQPLEIATACLFLASDASSYVTGISLPVDGGFLVS
ncbi:SDR family oxidoreductase [Sphingomonas sp. MG17]|uniref:SDR family oxidoreductase n=1 Tax=Sphingomonas tagetis TaxID=2949092 RepID=A0A9X2HHF3_9SPHN|nr:SDR family oxidoreductase [Sphingomonas tagetis]MCP3731266.1 SDR family oxidoreductase [Sphingomonas tagetis]